MKFLFLNLIGFIFFTLPMTVYSQQNESSSFIVSTYNIRYDNAADTLNGWNNRKHVIAELLLFQKADIIGIQEGLLHQVEELDSLLPDHSYIGVGRDDGAKKGEYTAIFYNQNLYEVLEDSTFWLSETPDQPSKGWDAAYPRICTWAVLKQKNSSAIIFVFNTHFDHKGKEARINSATLLLSKIRKIAENNPVLLLGDFNAEPDSEVYGFISNNELDDALTLSETPPFGPKATFNDFQFSAVPERRIDYIFVNKFFNIRRHGILNNHYGLKYPSDHFPVIAEVEFAID